MVRSSGNSVNQCYKLLNYFDSFINLFAPVGQDFLILDLLSLLPMQGKCIGLPRLVNQTYYGAWFNQDLEASTQPQPQPP